MPICEFCNKKKVNIIPYKCKCGLQRLCTICRYPESHECKYDFKKEGKLFIQKNSNKYNRNFLISFIFITIFYLLFSILHQIT
jgi:hypothetical protein